MEGWVYNFQRKMTSRARTISEGRIFLYKVTDFGFKIKWCLGKLKKAFYDGISYNMLDIDKFVPSPMNCCILNMILVRREYWADAKSEQKSVLEMTWSSIILSNFFYKNAFKYFNGIKVYFFFHNCNNIHTL